MQELISMRTRRAPSRRRGSVLVVALVAVMLGAGMLLGFMQVGVSFNREYCSRVEQERAHGLAEAGLEEALVALRRGRTGAVGSVAQPARLGGGLLWTTVTDAGSDLLRIVSVGAVGAGRVALERLVFHYSTDGYDAAIFADRDLVLSSNVLVDSFDSSLGSYQDQALLGGSAFVGETAVVQSNGSVAVDAATSVHGDVHPGRDDGLVLASNVTLTGSQEPMPEERVLPPVDVPPIPVGGPLFVAGVPMTLPPGDYGFAGIYVWNGSSLTVRGPSRIVLGDWVLNSNTQLVLDTTDGPIQVWALGDLDWRSNSNVSTLSQSATNASIFLAGGADQEATLRSNSEFYGRIYGPEARVEIRSNFEVFGAVLADELILGSNVRIHYDEALRQLSTEEVFVPGSTGPAAFPERSLLLSRRDPFQVLELDRDALPTPDAAQEP